VEINWVITSLDLRQYTYNTCIQHIFRTWGWKCNCRQ